MSIGWQRYIDPAQLEDDPAWSLFHENSKTSRHEPPVPNREVLARMGQLWDTLPYEGCPRVALPAPAPLTLPVGEAIAARKTARELAPIAMALDQLAALLHSAYGFTRDNEDGSFPRPFRTVPSGGALYPLELYVHSAYVDQLGAGLYHFNPRTRELALLQRGDHARTIGAALVQPNLSVDTSLQLFITAIFERSVFKYGDRGYRFVLLEAGHVAQNLNLAATALGLGCVNIGGFFDRDIDRLLGLDGVRHSTVYMVGIGRDAQATVDG